VKLHRIVGALEMAMAITALVVVMLFGLLMPKIVLLFSFISITAWLLAGYGLFKGRLWGWFLSVFLTAIGLITTAILALLRAPVYFMLLFYAVLMALLILSAGELGAKPSQLFKRKPEYIPPPTTVYTAPRPALASVFVEERRFVKRKR